VKLLDRSLRHFSLAVFEAIEYPYKLVLLFRCLTPFG
jgi:hypothetical protein